MMSFTSKIHKVATATATSRHETTITIGTNVEYATMMTAGAIQTKAIVLMTSLTLLLLIIAPESTARKSNSSHQHSSQRVNTSNDGVTRWHSTSPSPSSSSLSSSQPRIHLSTFTKCRRKKNSLVAAVVIPPVVQNLARGSILKCLADLTGGLVRETMIATITHRCSKFSRGKHSSHPLMPNLFCIFTLFFPTPLSSHSRYGNRASFSNTSNRVNPTIRTHRRRPRQSSET